MTMEHKPVERFVLINPIPGREDVPPVYIPDLDVSPVVPVELSKEEISSFLTNGILDSAKAIKRFSIAVDNSHADRRISKTEIPQLLSEQVRILDKSLIPEKIETPEEITMATQISTAKALALAEETTDAGFANKLNAFAKQTAEQASRLLSRNWRKLASAALIGRLATACSSTEGIPTVVNPNTTPEPTPTSMPTATPEAVFGQNIEVSNVTNEYKDLVLSNYINSNPGVDPNSVEVDVYKFSVDGRNDLSGWITNKITQTADSVTLFDSKTNQWINLYGEPTISNNPNYSTRIIWRAALLNPPSVHDVFIIDVPAEGSTEPGILIFQPLPDSNGKKGPFILPNVPGSPINGFFEQTSFNPTAVAPEGEGGIETETQQIVEVVEENKASIAEYQARIFWGINKDKTYYWEQIGVHNEQSLITFLEDNDYTLPASNDGSKTKLLYFGVGNNNEHVTRPLIVMDKPLSLSPEFLFLSPDTDPLSLPRTGLIEYGLSSNTSKDEGERSASAGTIIEDKGDVRVVKYVIYWKDDRYDLFGNPYNNDINTIKLQANQVSQLMFNFFLSYSIYDEGKTTTAGEIAKQYNNWAPLNNSGIDSAYLSTFFTGLKDKIAQIPATELPPTILK